MSTVSGFGGTKQIELNKLQPSSAIKLCLEVLCSAAAAPSVLSVVMWGVAVQDFHPKCREIWPKLTTGQTFATPSPAATKKPDIYTEKSSTILHPYKLILISVSSTYMCESGHWSMHTGDISKSVETYVEKRVGAKSR